METRYKIVVFVPETHADIVRDAIGEAGGGKIGKYTHCSFSIKGIARFKPEKGSHPTIGEVGKLELVEEEKIEVMCEESNLQNVIDAVKKVHPYEEVVIDVYPLTQV